MFFSLQTKHELVSVITSNGVHTRNKLQSSLASGLRPLRGDQRAAAWFTPTFVSCVPNYPNKSSNGTRPRFNWTKQGSGNTSFITKRKAVEKEQYSKCKEMQHCPLMTLLTSLRSSSG